MKPFYALPVDDRQDMFFFPEPTTMKIGRGLHGDRGVVVVPPSEEGGIHPVTLVIETRYAETYLIRMGDEVPEPSPITLDAFAHLPIPAGRYTALDLRYKLEEAFDHSDGFIVLSKEA